MHYNLNTVGKGGGHVNDNLCYFQSNYSLTSQFTYIWLKNYGFALLFYAEDRPA